MAEFNATPQSQPTGSYTGMSQGVYADRNDALGRLFGTLADGLEKGVAAADAAVIDEIEEQAFLEVELARQEFGGPYATTIQEDVDTGRASRIPEHISQSLDTVSNLQAAYVSGNLKESHYWARMNAVVRQLRGRYPGYRQEIDAAVSNLVGGVPANRLQSALFSEWAAAASQDTEADRLRKLEDSATAAGTMPPDYWERAQKGNPYSFIELQQYVAMRNKIDNDISTRRATLGEAADNHTLNERKALTSFEADAQATVSRILYDSSRAIGQDYAKIQERVQEAQAAALAGTPISQEDMTQIQVAANTLRNKMQLALEKEFSAAWWGNPNHAYSKFLSGADRDAAIARALAPVDLMIESLSAGDVTIANQIMVNNEARLTDAGARLLDQFPFVANVAAISDMAGPEVTAIYFDAVPHAQDVMSYAFSTAEAVKAARPTYSGGIRQALETISNDPNLDPSLGISLVTRWENVMDLWSEGKLTDDIIRNNIQYMFSEGAESIFDTLDTREDQLEYFRRVSSPRISNIMLELKSQGDIESWETYRDWVWNGFQAVFRDSAQNMNKTLEQGFDIQWDHANSRFRVLGKNGGDITNVMDTLGWRVMHFGSTPPQDVTYINQALRNIVPLIQEEGGDVPREVLLLLQRAGFNPNTPEDRRTPVHRLWDSLYSWITQSEVEAPAPVQRSMTGGGF